MNVLKEGWLSDIDYRCPDVCLSLKIDEVLYHEKSKYQDVMVVQTKAHGRALVLDGAIQNTERDEFTYQEAIAFLSLCSHPNPENVLIIGGGDGGVAREVAKHPAVKKITQVEIDSCVLDVSKKYMPSMAVGLTHPKVNVLVEDGFDYMKRHTSEFDVIITDSSDPVGPAESLFQEPYFKLISTALRPGGIIANQGEFVWLGLSEVKQTLTYCRSTFPVVNYCTIPVPTYPTGQIGIVMASLNPDTNFKEPLRTFTEEELDDMNLRFYSADVHRAVFTLPRFAAKDLGLLLKK